MTLYEQSLVWNWVEAFMTVKDNLPIQYRPGLISDDLREIERRNISSHMEWACFRDHWPELNNGYSEDFSREVESAPDAYPINECTSVVQ